MEEPSPRSDPSVDGKQPGEADRLRDILRAPRLSDSTRPRALIGIPVSPAAFWFLVGLHELEHVL
jgi:hypothetical protein